MIWLGLALSFFLLSSRFVRFCDHLAPAADRRDAHGSEAER
jgi:hypothetical protein